MNKKTVAIFAICMLLVSALSVFATLAFLTDSSEVVTNTFTSGNVNILLDETYINPTTYVADPDADRVQNNTYKVYPNVTYTKDPLITVEANSEDCYVGVVIKVTNVSNLTAAGITKDTFLEKCLKNGDAAGINTGFEKINNNDETNTWEYVLVYEKMEGADQVALEAGNTVQVFTDFVTPNFDNTQLANFTDAENGTEIIVHGYAVQAASFSDAGTALKAAFPTVFTPAA